MSRITTFAQGEPLADRLRRERLEREQQTNVLEGIVDAVNSEWFAAWAWRGLTSSLHDVDPSFDPLAQDTWDTLTDGLDSDFWGPVAATHSMEQAQHVRRHMLGVQESRQNLARLGYTGVALQMGASILDPAAIALSIAATPAGIATKGSRLARMAKAGLVAAPSEAAFETSLTTMDPQRDAKDILYAGLGAFVLGGATGVWGGTKLSKLAKEARDQMDYEQAIAQGLPLSKRGIAEFEKLSAGSQQKVLDDLKEIVGELPEGLDGTPAEQLAKLAAFRANEMGNSPNVAMGAASIHEDLTPDPVDLLRGADSAEGVQTKNIGTLRPDKVEVDDFNPDPEPVTEGARFAGARWGMSTSLARSAAPLVKSLGAVMVQDVIPRIDRVTGKVKKVPEAASQWVKRRHDAAMAHFHTRTQDAYVQWAKAKGIRAAVNYEARNQFMEEVGIAVRTRRGMDGGDLDPNVARAADVVREMNRNLLRLAQRHGVRGLESVDENDTYLMRIWSHPRITQRINDHGEENVVRLFSQAIRDESIGLDDDQIEKVARGFVGKLTKLGQFSDVQRAASFSTARSEMLEEVLREQGFTDDVIEDILYDIQPRADEGKIRSAKRRLRLNENARIDIEFDGKATGETLSITDLVENNAETLTHLYSRQILGASAMTKVMDRAAAWGTSARRASQAADEGVAPEDILASPVNTLESMLRLVEKQFAELGVDKNSWKAKRDIRNLTTAYKYIMGHRLFDDVDGPVSDAFRNIRKANHSILSGGFGVAQFAETGNVVGEVGFRAMVTQMPALRQIFKRARDGGMTNELLREMEEVWAFGTDGINNSLAGRFYDPGDYGFSYSGARGWQRNRPGTFMEKALHSLRPGESVDRATDRLVQFSNIASGLHAVNAMLQRAAGVAAAQKWLDIAYKNGRIPSDKRLALMGLDRDMASRITEQMRTHASQAQSGNGKRQLRKININDWDDIEAASAFVSSLSQWGRRAVQQNDIGQFSPWMTNEFGRTILQFRSFVIAAYEQQLLTRVAMADPQAFAGAMWTSLMGAFAYTVQQYTLSIGREDADEFRKERLSTQAIAAAAVNRAGWASFLPSVYDQMVSEMGGDPMFSHSRNTQLNTLGFFSNPSLDLLDKVGGAALGTAGVAVDPNQQFTQEDAKSLAYLLPFRNLVGVKNVIDAMVTRFPEDE